jgi:hypothetical protein
MDLENFEHIFGKFLTQTLTKLYTFLKKYLKIFIEDFLLKYFKNIPQKQSPKRVPMAPINPFTSKPYPSLS